MATRRSYRADNRISGMYVDGSAAREFDFYREYREEEERKKAQKQARALHKAEARSKAIRMVVTVVGGLMVIATCVLLLSTIVKNNDLMHQIDSLEAELAEIKEQNDSKEYDINSSVDLDYIIKIATEDLGMIRSTAGQILTYETQDAEYLEQVAEIPTE